MAMERYYAFSKSPEIEPGHQFSIRLRTTVFDGVLHLCSGCNKRILYPVNWVASYLNLYKDILIFGFVRFGFYYISPLFNVKHCLYILNIFDFSTHFVDNILNQPALILLHTNVFKSFYKIWIILSLLIICLHTAKSFQVLQCNSKKLISVTFLAQI